MRRAWHPQGDLAARGFDGLCELWSEWLSAWTSYHSTVEDVIEAGGKVIVEIRDRAVARESGVEVELRAASVWTVRDGLIGRVEFHLTRESAMRSAGA